MKKVIGILALIGIGIAVVSSSKKSDTSATSNTENQNETIDSVIAKYNNQKVIINDASPNGGYYSVVVDGKVRPAFESEYATHTITKIGIEFWKPIAEQFNQYLA